VAMNYLDRPEISLSRLRQIATPDVWDRCMKHLQLNVQQSPYQAKIIADFHWLELELGRLVLSCDSIGTVSEAELNPLSFPALRFAKEFVDLHEKLVPDGQSVMKGRLKAGLLDSDSGLAALFLELDTAGQLREEGFSVEFPDILIKPLNLYVARTEMNPIASFGIETISSVINSANCPGGILKWASSLKSILRLEDEIVPPSVDTTTSLPTASW